MGLRQNLWVINSKTARLHWGRIVTDVPPKAVGFKVDTECASVLDMGTRCGIYVDRQFGKDAQTEIHVFEGLVELHPRLSSKQKIRKLATGQAGLIDRNKAASLVVFTPSMNLIP